MTQGRKNNLMFPIAILTPSPPEWVGNCRHSKFSAFFMDPIRIWGINKGSKFAVSRRSTSPDKQRYLPLTLFVVVVVVVAVCLRLFQSKYLFAGTQYLKSLIRIGQWCVFIFPKCTMYFFFLFFVELRRKTFQLPDYKECEIRKE